MISLAGCNHNSKANQNLSYCDGYIPYPKTYEMGQEFFSVPKTTKLWITNRERIFFDNKCDQ